MWTCIGGNDCSPPVQVLKADNTQMCYEHCAIFACLNMERHCPNSKEPSRNLGHAFRLVPCSILERDFWLVCFLPVTPRAPSCNVTKARQASRLPRVRGCGPWSTWRVTPAGFSFLTCIGRGTVVPWEGAVGCPHGSVHERCEGPRGPLSSWTLGKSLPADGWLPSSWPRRE